MEMLRKLNFSLFFNFLWDEADSVLTSNGSCAAGLGSSSFSVALFPVRWSWPSLSTLPVDSSGLEVSSPIWPMAKSSMGCPWPFKSISGLTPGRRTGEGECVSSDEEDRSLLSSSIRSSTLRRASSKMRTSSSVS